MKADSAETELECKWHDDVALHKKSMEAFQAELLAACKYVGALSEMDVQSLQEGVNVRQTELEVLMHILEALHGKGDVVKALKTELLVVRDFVGALGLLKAHPTQKLPTGD